MKLLNNKTFITFIKFGLVGLSGAVINIIIFSILISKGVAYQLAFIAAFLVAVTNNFILNFKWTFKERASDKSVKRKYVQFFTISVINLGVNYVFLELFIKIFGNTEFIKHIIGTYFGEANVDKLIKIISQMFAIGVAMVLNFIGNHLITFRHKEED